MWVLHSAQISLTCSITSGAIQHGVPTNVLRTLFLVMSPPVARKALTPKSSEILNKNVWLHSKEVW